MFNFLLIFKCNSFFFSIASIFVILYCYVIWLFFLFSIFFLFSFFHIFIFSLVVTRGHSCVLLDSIFLKRYSKHGECYAKLVKVLLHLSKGCIFDPIWVSVKLKILNSLLSFKRILIEYYINWQLVLKSFELSRFFFTLRYLESE